MRYPPIEPYEQGWLEVGDRNAVYWSVSGHPEGKPALIVHGGPGSGSSPGMRRSFDPRAYRIVQFDQRGCGRSRPHAADPATDLSVKQHLGVDRWLIFGGSWGSTLSLAYAERYPDRVTELILAGVTTGRHSEVDWLYRGVARFFPEAWHRFRDALPESARAGDLVTGYARLMEAPDPTLRLDAARAWCAWEDAVVSEEEYGTPNPYGSRPERDLVGFVRICAHYAAHRAWLAEDELHAGADRLAGIAGVLLHGRLDLSGPPGNAWELSQRWPDAELTIFGGSGHKGNEAMMAKLLQTTDRFRPA